MRYAVERRIRVLVFAAVLLCSAGCDHLTKQLASGRLADVTVVSLAADTVRLELHHNLGGFLSLGTELPRGVRNLLFIAIVPLGLLLACVLALRRATLTGWSVVGLGLVAGGGVANWLDRVAHGGAVTDFVSLGLGPLRSGIFNVADVWVVAGALLLILATHSSGAAGGDGG